MKEQEIKTVDDVYRFVERVRAEAERHGAANLATQFDDALHLGSSGLEILGGIQQAIVENRGAITQMLGPGLRDEVDQVIAFVDRAFGR